MQQHQHASSKAHSGAGTLTAAPCSSTLHATFQSAHTTPTRAPCWSSTLQPHLARTSAPKPTHDSDSSTRKQHPAAAPARPLQESARSTPTNTLQQHTLQWHQHAPSKAQTPLWQQHPQAGAGSGTNMPAPKRRHATRPILEVRTSKPQWLRYLGTGKNNK